MRVTHTGEICILNDNGTSGFEKFECGVEDWDDWRGGRVISDVHEVAGNAKAFALEGGELACSDVVGDDLEGDSEGVVVIGVLAGDGMEEVGSVFDSAGHWADGVLVLGNGDNKAAGCEADCGFDTDDVVNVRWGED